MVQMEKKGNSPKPVFICEICALFPQWLWLRLVYTNLTHEGACVHTGDQITPCDLLIHLKVTQNLSRLMVIFLKRFKGFVMNIHVICHMS